MSLSVCADAAQHVDIADQTENDEKSGNKIIGAHANTEARIVPIKAPIVAQRNPTLIAWSVSSFCS
jgi:hypothetical protein